MCAFTGEISWVKRCAGARRRSDHKHAVRVFRGEQRPEVYIQLLFFLSDEVSLTVSLPKLGERVKHELDGVRDRDTSKSRVASASTTPRFGVRDPCENPALQPNDWNTTLRAVSVKLGASAPGATIIDMDTETVTELDGQIALVVEPSRSWSMPSRLSPA